MADKDPIDDQALDDLLRNLYLDEKSKNVDESEAKFIMEQNYDIKIDPAKEATFTHWTWALKPIVRKYRNWVYDPYATR